MVLLMKIYGYCLLLLVLMICVSRCVLGVLLGIMMCWVVRMLNGMISVIVSSG